MCASELPLHLTFSETGADDEQLDELTRYLADDLMELGVESVERTQAAIPPEQAKGAEMLAWGALALVTAPTLLPSLLDFLQRWTGQDDNRRVTIKTPSGLEITFTPQQQLSPSELLALVEKLGADGKVEQKLPAPEPDARVSLRQFLINHFDAEELRTLAFDLNIDYDSLPGQGKAAKARELVALSQRHGRFQELHVAARRMRPRVSS
jgi:hypothetical protein